MVSPFHKIANAKNAIDNVRRDPSTEDVEIEEELGRAVVEFRFSQNASVQAVKGLDHTLRSSGFEEQHDEENTGIRDMLVYEWDKTYLSED